MTNIKKITLSLGSLAAAAMPVVAVVSCSDIEINQTRLKDPYKFTLKDLNDLVNDLASGKRDTVKLKLINEDGKEREFMLDASNLDIMEERVKSFLGY